MHVIAFEDMSPFLNINISICLSRVYISTNTIIELLTKCKFFCWSRHRQGPRLTLKNSKGVGEPD